MASISTYGKGCRRIHFTRADGTRQTVYLGKMSDKGARSILFRIEAIAAPSLLIVGSEDFSAIIERHETLSETMPNAFAVLLDGVAHLPSIERPDLVNSLLLQFLDAFDGEDEDEDGDED